jgi:hemolysin III
MAAHWRSSPIPSIARGAQPTQRLGERHSEELANAATHALGLGLSIGAAVLLLWRVSQFGGPWQVWGCSIYAATLVAAYAASTLSHMFRDPRLRDAYRTADQALIFLFIAGSFTPVAFAWLRSPPWWWLFHAVVWGVALIGFVSKAVFSHRVAIGTVSAVLYVLLGWSPLLVGNLVIAACPTDLLLWLLAGGVCYTTGILTFFRYDHRVRYFHAAWHVLVMAGSACHYLGVLFYCTGQSG